MARPRGRDTAATEDQTAAATEQEQEQESPVEAPEATQEPQEPAQEAKEQPKATEPDQVTEAPKSKPAPRTRKARRPKRRKSAATTAKARAGDEPPEAGDQTDWRAELAKLQAKVEELSGRAPEQADTAAVERRLLPDELVEPPPVRHGSAPMTIFRDFEGPSRTVVLYAGRDERSDARTGLAIRGASMRVAQFEHYLWRTDDEWELKTFMAKSAVELKMGTIRNLQDVMRAEETAARAQLDVLQARLANPDAPVTPAATPAPLTLGPPVNPATQGAMGVKMGGGEFEMQPKPVDLGTKESGPVVREKPTADLPPTDPPINPRIERPTAATGRATVRE